MLRRTGLFCYLTGRASQRRCLFQINNSLPSGRETGRTVSLPQAAHRRSCYYAQKETPRRGGESHARGDRRRFCPGRRPVRTGVRVRLPADGAKRSRRGVGSVPAEESAASIPEESQPSGGNGLFFSADDLPPDAESPRPDEDSLPSDETQSDLESGSGGDKDCGVNFLGASPEVLSAVLEGAGVQLPDRDVDEDMEDKVMEDKVIPYGEDSPPEEDVQAQVAPAPPERSDSGSPPAGGDVAAAPSVVPAEPARRTAARARTASGTASRNGTAVVNEDSLSPVLPMSARQRVRMPAGSAAEHAAFFGLDFHDLDRNLTPEQRQEWNSIYASYRGRSVMTGTIAGFNHAPVRVTNSQTGKSEYRTLYCAVVIPYRVPIMIPETEMWFQGEERPIYVLRNMENARIDFVIKNVDRENGFAVGSRKMALPSRRYYFSTQPGMNRPGSRIQCSVMTVGPRRCLVTCHGYDLDLAQRDMSWKPIPNLQEVYHTDDILDCIVKEYNSRENRLVISVKEAEPNPFDGAEFRHPVGCSCAAIISGKYGGGVFCTLPDDVTVMCNYAFHYDDNSFNIGDRVVLLVERYEDVKKQVYGKIVAKR